MPLINKNGATSSVNCHINKLYLFCSRQSFLPGIASCPHGSRKEGKRVWFVAFNNDNSSKMYMTHLRRLPLPPHQPAEDAKKHNNKKKEKHHNEPKNDLPFQSEESWGNFFIAARISVCVCVCVDLVSSAVGVLWQLDRPRRGMGMRAGDQLRLSARISFAACGGRRQKCR